MIGPFLGKIITILRFGLNESEFMRKAHVAMYERAVLSWLIVPYTQWSSPSLRWPNKRCSIVSPNTASHLGKVTMECSTNPNSKKTILDLHTLMVVGKTWLFLMSFYWHWFSAKKLRDKQSQSLGHKNFIILECLCCILECLCCIP